MYADLAPKLFANGWRNLLPLTHGKGTYAKWRQLQHQDMTERTLAYYIEKHGNAPRLGVVFGPNRGLVAIDIDISDPLLIDRVHGVYLDTLPRTNFVRVGRAPKVLLLYRGTVKSRKMHPIEVFGSSGQIAAFGNHPATGRPYQWPHRSILDHGPNDLPLVTQEQVEAFLSGCAQFLSQRGSDGQPIGQTDFLAALANERRMDGAKAAARQLMNLREGQRHPVMLSVTGFLVSKGYDPSEIVDFVDDFFPEHLRKEEWSNVRNRAEAMVADAIEKFSNTDWSL
jgi:hypothetical protein